MRLHILILFLLGASLSFAQTDVLLTDFQNGIPLDYTIVDNDGETPDLSVSEYNAAWISLVDPENAIDTVASATSFFSPNGTADRWMITPPLSLGNYGNFIEWQAKSQDASYADDYLVLVSTTDDQLASFTDTIGYVIQENPEWTARSVDLSEAGYNGQTIYVAFRLITTDGFKLYVDDIHAWKDDPVGLFELSNELKFSCYPNPTTDKLHLETTSKIVKSSVYTSNGTFLESFTSQDYSVNHLNPGVYLLKIETEAGQRTLRFIKN